MTDARHDQQPMKETAENFTSGEDVLKKPAVSLHEQPLSDCEKAWLEQIQIENDLNAEIHRLKSALHTVEGKLANCCPTCRGVKSLDVSEFYPPDELDALVTAEREKI